MIEQLKEPKKNSFQNREPAIFPFSWVPKSSVLFVTFKRLSLPFKLGYLKCIFIK
jgi:hypothetical protein